jgi:hypothetical protein
MNLSCPKCNSEATQKLSLVMSQGGVAEKGAQLGASYGVNIVVPAMTVVVGLLIGVMFAMANPLLGLAAFAGVLYAGYTLRKKLKAKTKSKYADLSPQMKQSGYQCNRCENLFIPT